MNNVHVIARELRAKLETGTVTREDAKQAFEVARATGRLEDRVLYAAIKQKVNESEK